MKQKKGKLGLIIFLVIICFLLLWIIISLFVSVKSFGNVALIPIKGVITVEGTSSFGSEGASSTEIIEFIQDAEKDSSIEAILFDINSPGGSAVASKEIADAVKRTTKPTYAVIREVGASGAYWVASATDHIMANELSITGSIGVISSYIEFAGLLDRYNMTYQRLTAGKYKDLGDPFKELQLDERGILLRKLDIIHEYFIADVAENRNITVEELRKIATGEFYLGSEALEFGLIDSLGDIEKAKELIKQELNITKVELAKYEKLKTLIDVLSGVFSEQSFFVGRGIGSTITEQQPNRFEIIT